MTSSGYAVVTPARDERENLRRLAGSLIGQTLRPAAWIIVDSGSTDGTVAEAEQLAARHDWIRVGAARPDSSARPGAPIVRAFHAGLAQLGTLPEVVVKVDADVAFPPDHFERLVAEFAGDPLLGIAGGSCWERNDDGEWRPVHVTDGHVRGAARAYRRACLEELLPLPELAGWDTVDALQATVRGWTTRTVPELRFDHYRAVGARDGSRSSRWIAKGKASHYLGYRPGYLLLRALHNGRSDRAALAMVWGYAAAALRREPRHPDLAAREVLRRRQSLRNVPRHIRGVRASARAAHAPGRRSGAR